MPPSSFTILELSGQGRSVELAERGVPYRPIEWEGEQRVTIDWLAGSPEATGQVFGAQEDPSEFSGWWKDRFVKATQDDGTKRNPDDDVAIITIIDGGQKRQATDCMDAVKFVDSIRRQGQLVKVTWDAIVRHGILKRFKQKWHRREDVEWTMGFEWISQGEPSAPAVLPTKNAINETQGKLAAFLGKMVDLATKAGEGLAIAGEYRDQINAKIAKVASTLELLNDAVGATVELSLSPQDSARRVTGIVTTARLDAEDLLETLDATSPDSAATSSGVNQTAGAVLAVQVFVRDMKTVCNDQRREMARQQDQLIQQTDTELLDVFTADEGSDLRDVSVRYYGTPDEARFLMGYNGLSSTALAAGMVILVPRLTASGGAQ